MPFIGTLDLYNVELEKRRRHYMGLAIGIIIFIIGCCISSYEDETYRAQKRAEQRHRELMRVLEDRQELTPSVPKRTRITRRRFVRDKDGNILGEEITEEEVED